MGSLPYHRKLKLLASLACIGLVYNLVWTQRSRLEGLVGLLPLHYQVAAGKELPASDDEDWGAMTCAVPPISTPDDFYNYIHRHQYTCDKPVMVGGQLKTHPPYMVGEKWVCMSPSFNIVPGQCVVLSFGIDRDFSFDDDLDKRFDCKVFAFDPTIGLETHHRSPNIMFYNLGIGGRDGSHGVMKRPLARYSTILDMLDLRNATIDYLKLDVEGAELDFFSDVLKRTPNLLKNVKQIGMEIHLFHVPGMRMLTEKLWTYFHYLKCYGFKLVFSEINPVQKLRFNFRGQERSCCYELVWVRERQW